MATVFDASFAIGNVSTDAVRAAGGVGMIGYVSPDAAKNISRGDVDRFHAAQLSVGFVWEASSGDATRGPILGHSHGREAFAQLVGLGVPNGVACYFACDTDVSDPTIVAPYAQGFVAELHGRPCGVYGGAPVVRYLRTVGPCQYGWWAAASAWDHGQDATAFASLHQRVGSPVAGTDANNVLASDWGQWSTASEDDMFEDTDRTVLVQIRDAIANPQPGSHSRFDDVLAQIATTHAAVNAQGKAILDAIAKLPTGPGGSVSKADVEAAVVAVLRSVTAP